jgi:hypothetical protein
LLGAALLVARHLRQGGGLPMLRMMSRPVEVDHGGPGAAAPAPRRVI